jgi:hypothetical protein
MLWKVPEADLLFVIDPFASQLDFGIPCGYRSNKKVLGEQEVLKLVVKSLTAAAAIDLLPRTVSLPRQVLQ